MNRSCFFCSSGTNINKTLLATILAEQAEKSCCVNLFFVTKTLYTAVKVFKYPIKKLNLPQASSNKCVFAAAQSLNTKITASAVLSGLQQTYATYELQFSVS